MIPYIYLFLMSILDIIMESSVKLFDISNKNKFIILAMLIYSLQPLLFYNVMKQGKYGIGITNILWNIISSIIVLLFGISYFNEKINKIQIIGIVFGILSLYLIDYKKNNINLNIQF